MPWGCVAYRVCAIPTALATRMARLVCFIALLACASVARAERPHPLDDARRRVWNVCEGLYNWKERVPVCGLWALSRMREGGVEERFGVAQRECLSVCVHVYSSSKDVLVQSTTYVVVR